MTASERIEPGADAAHRDDLARDVARLWVAKRRDIEERARLTGAKAFPLPDPFADALNRLVKAYEA